MSSRLRFTSARQIFDTFQSASDDIATPPANEAPLDFARKLARSSRPIEAVAFCAYLLPRREAVWWACQCVRAIQGDQAGADLALKAAEAWVREPEEATRRAALDLGASENRRAPTTWLARAAGWSGGDMAAAGLAPTPAPPHLTAKAVLRGDRAGDGQGRGAQPGAWTAACTDACIRFRRGRRRAPAPGAECGIAGRENAAARRGARRLQPSRPEAESAAPRFILAPALASDKIENPGHAGAGSKRRLRRLDRWPGKS